MENISNSINDEIISLKKNLCNYSQEHLIDNLNLITDFDRKQNYINQIKGIDYELIKNLYENNLLKTEKSTSTHTDKDFSPIESNFVKDSLTNSEYEYTFRQGLNKIYEGKVALLILAGGQGSRLGLEKPKGMYNIKMPSNKSLFEYLCNRFLSVQNLAQKIINSENSSTSFTPSTLLIMTSVENHNDTLEFFHQNNYFDIDKDNIIFFPQDTLPAIDLTGKVINKEIDSVFLAPNGNGGCFISLKKNKIIQKCSLRNIDYINVISIDNPLSITLDPLFIGLTSLQNYQMAAKTIKKNSASESIGIFLNLNHKPTMMDYMDVPKHLTELKDEEGSLIYRGGNILNYLIGVKILNEILNDEVRYEELINEFHVGKKKIPAVVFTEDKIKFEHEIVDGVKFELFFNSIFKFADNKGLLLLEVGRNEFAPVKNDEKSQNDNPITSRMLMTKTFLEWYENSGGVVNQVEETNKNFKLEISYLLSFNGENLSPGKNIPKAIDNTGSYYFN